MKPNRSATIACHCNINHVSQQRRPAVKQSAYSYSARSQPSLGAERLCPTVRTRRRHAHSTPGVHPGAIRCRLFRQPRSPQNHSCLDTYLIDNVAVRLYNHCKLELVQGLAPPDPSVPPGRRDGWPTIPETTPPMPFTEWPYGAATSLGVNRPNSVDSPLMAAIANTNFGKVLSDLHIQLHGWVDSGGNISINNQRPAGYAYTPNVAQLDQAVVYIERTPDTVQRDHIDWGFRVSGIYGDNYRYTTSYGLASYQFLKHDNPDGYDFPMVYGEGYLPNILQGLVIRAGRYISLPDIEAQLAPDNHMYTHSFYDFGSYTSTGGVGTLAVTRDLLLHLGISGGTKTPTWHAGAQVPNLMPNNALYSGTQFKRPRATSPRLPVASAIAGTTSTTMFGPA